MPARLRSWVPLWRALLIAALLAIAGAMPPIAISAEKEKLPKLLEGAAFWIGEPLKEKDLDKDQAVEALAFDRDGKRLIAGRRNGLVVTIDVTRREVVSSVKAHDAAAGAVVFRPGRTSYFTSGADNRIREFGVPRGRSVEIRDASLAGGEPMAISPDGTSIAVGHYGGRNRRDKAITIYDSDSGKRLRSVADEHGARSLAFSRDGRMLLSIGTWGNQVQLWDVATLAPVWSRTEERAYKGEAIDAPFLSGCAFGPGEQEYTVAIDNSWSRAMVCIYDLESGKLRKEFSSAQGHIKFALSPDAKTLAIGGYDAVLDIWDIQTEKRLVAFFGKQERIFCLAYSPDSRSIASGGQDGTIIVWTLPARPEPARELRR